MRVSIASLMLMLCLNVSTQVVAAELVAHDIDVALDPATAGLQAVDRVQLRFEAGDTAALSFLLNGDLNVESVALNGVVLDLEALRRWRPKDFWAKPNYAELGTFSTAKHYRVSAPAEGWPEAATLEFRFAGTVYDSLAAPKVAYSRGFETTSGLIDERGAYLSYETFWIPWFGDGRFDFRLRTVLPSNWHSMSQGRRAEHGELDGRNVTVWQSEGGQELVYLIAGPYTIRERKHKGVSLFTYTYENTPEDLCNTYLDASVRYLDLYGDRYGDYAFAKWAMVENWWQTGYGMPGFTLLGDRVIRLPFIVDTSYGHEILHCWWGNGVYVDYENGNWCEGLTAYGADYTYKLEQSAMAARDYRRDTLVGYLDFASAEDRDFALRDFRERSDYGTQAIGYGKSLMVFHMLENLVGGEMFQKGMREFYSRFLLQPASWDDIADVYSELTQTDLRAWFEQWVDRVGSARLAIGEVRPLDEGYSIELIQEGEPYELQVRVEWDDAEVTHSEVLEISTATHEFHLPATARAVRVDPTYQVFRRLYRDEIPPTLSQVLGADSTTVVIGDACSAEMTKALVAVAEKWAENQDMRIVAESDFQPDDHAGRSRFLLGPGKLADAAMDEARVRFGNQPTGLGVEALEKNLSLVYCVRDPASPELAWTVVLPASPDDCEAVGRKLPHYSKYSWLSFEADQNVGKGAWTVMTSPLHRDLSGSGK